MRVSRSWSALAGFFLLFLGVSNAQFGKGPPRFSMDNLPQTRFTCEGRLFSRYYADQETDCQMFHVCTRMTSSSIQNFRFLCPNGTVFDQEHQVCADYYQVVCLANIGTNPLGQIFELYKLNSKESTNRQEFGEAPIQDPDYIGQNHLGGGEDFQAEEYNNNKLAASQNSLPYQSYEKSNPQNIFYQTISTQRPTTTTTERYVPSTTRQSARLRTTTTLEPLFQTPAPTEDSSEIDFSDFSALSKFQNAFHKGGFSTARPSTTSEQPYSTTTFAPYVEYSTEQRYAELETNPPSTTTYATTKRPFGFQAVDPDELDFSDFSTLSKFQNDFHRSFSVLPSTTSRPFQQFREPTTSRPESQEQDPQFKNFGSLAKSQYNSNRGFTEGRSTTGSTFDNARLEVTEYTTDLPSTTFATKSTARPSAFDAGKFDFSNFGSLHKFQNSFHTSFNGKVSSTPSTQLKKVQIILAKTKPSTTTLPPPPSAPVQQDSGEFLYNSFSSKLVNSFNQESPIPPAPVDEYQDVPLQKSKIIATRPTTTYAPRTQPPPPPPAVSQGNGELQISPDFSDFTALSKFQNSFHKVFKQQAATTEPAIPNHEFPDFNTKPRTETQPPLFNFQQTTVRSPVYQNTFRTTFTDLTTPATPTFQQQATRFGDDFFIRQPTSSRSQEQVQDSSEITPKPIKFSPVYQGPTDKQKTPITKKSQAQVYDTSEVETFPPKTKHVGRKFPEPINENEELVVSSSARPLRRGRKRLPPHLRGKEPLPQEPQYKYSRRVENARFEDRESYAVRERSQAKTDEIFNAEASVFRGSAHANTYYVRPAQLQPTTTTQAPTQSTAKASEPLPTIFGRRVRPFRKEQQVTQAEEPQQTESQDSGEARKSGKTRVVKRLRQKSTTAAEVLSTQTPAESSSMTTNSKPSRVRTKTITVHRRIGGEREITSGPVPHRDRPNASTPSSTTTVEPELVTASDEEVERLREENTKPKVSTIVKVHEVLTTEKSPTTKTIPILSKESLKRVKEEENIKDSKPDKNDYDYTYYDTERDHDYSDISSNFGIKPGKSIVKN